MGCLQFYDTTLANINTTIFDIVCFYSETILKLYSCINISTEIKNMEDRFDAIKHFIVTLVSMHAWQMTNDRYVLLSQRVTKNIFDWWKSSVNHKYFSNYNKTRM